MNGRDSTRTPVHHPDLALTTVWNSWSVIHTIDMIKYIIHVVSLLGLKGKILWSSVYTRPAIGASVLVLQYANLELQLWSLEKQNFVSLFLCLLRIFEFVLFIGGFIYFPKRQYVFDCLEDGKQKQKMEWPN